MPTQKQYDEEVAEWEATPINSTSLARAFILGVALTLAVVGLFVAFILPNAAFLHRNPVTEEPVFIPLYEDMAEETVLDVLEDVIESGFEIIHFRERGIGVFEFTAISSDGKVSPCFVAVVIFMDDTWTYAFLNPSEFPCKPGPPIPFSGNTLAEEN